MRTSFISWTFSTLLIVFGIGWYLWWQSANAYSPESFLLAQNSIGGEYSESTSTPQTRATSTAPVRTQTNASTTPRTPAMVQITYDGAAFTPQNITIAKGATVIFTDIDGHMWVASDPEPERDGYDGTTADNHCAPGSATSLDQCIPGSTYSFTFAKVGSFSYHDHMNPAAIGTITVQ